MLTMVVEHETTLARIVTDMLTSTFCGIAIWPKPAMHTPHRAVFHNVMQYGDKHTVYSTIMYKDSSVDDIKICHRDKDWEWVECYLKNNLALYED